MKSCDEAQDSRLRVDGKFGFEYLVAAVIRSAVQDGDTEWLERCGVEWGEFIGIDRKDFMNGMRRVRSGRNM